MKIMDTLIGSYKKKPKQDRAAKTKQDLLHTANEILDRGDLDDLSAKALSIKSGYSVGVIYKYFNKYEDIFIKIFLNKIDAHFKEVEQIYIDHQPLGISEYRDQLIRYRDQLFRYRDHAFRDRDRLVL